MTLAQKVYHFLQVDNLVCANCGKQLSPLTGYRKMVMWRQYAFFTLRWLAEVYSGDNYVLRFCLVQPRRSLLDVLKKRHPAPSTTDCFAEFTGKGRLIEIEAK